MAALNEALNAACILRILRCEQPELATELFALQALIKKKTKLKVSTKKKVLFFPEGSSRGESENIVAEDGLGNPVQPVQIRNRVKPLRLVTP